jgi:hypothetical protein
MADDKKKGAKGAKGATAAKPAKAEKAEKKPEKVGKAARAARERTSERGAVSSERPKGSIGKPRMAKHYEDNARPELMKKFAYVNVMQAPRLVKIVINMGVGDSMSDQKLMDSAVNELGQITGQRPSVRKGEEGDLELQAARGAAVGWR